MTRSRNPRELVESMKVHGRAKVLFGSNYPIIEPAKALEGLENLNLDTEVKNMFLYENARCVFKL